jgi:hypothetical protein
MQGCDASLLLHGSTSGPTEQDAPPNLTLRPEGFEVINDLRELVHDKCGKVVSCADITALAARDSVFLVKMLTIYRKKKLKKKLRDCDRALLRTRTGARKHELFYSNNLFKGMGYYLGRAPSRRPLTNNRNIGNNIQGLPIREIYFVSQSF